MTTQITLNNGTTQEVKPLSRPVGLFNHYYLDENGDPKFVSIIGQGEQMEHLGDQIASKLTEALLNKRYMIALFTIDDSEPPIVTIHRNSCDFSFHHFETAKKLFSQNLDEEYQKPNVPIAAPVAPPQPAMTDVANMLAAKIAETTNRADELQKEIDAEE